MTCDAAPRRVTCDDMSSRVTAEEFTRTVREGLPSGAAMGFEIALEDAPTEPVVHAVMTYSVPPRGRGEQ